MRIENRNLGKAALFFFFIHPFAAFLLAINNLKSKYSNIVLLLFFTLFGYTFIVQNPNIDSYRYIENFDYYKYQSPNNFFLDVKDYFTFDSQIKDLYEITSYFVVSRLTYNYHFLMALWAIIFSFFFLRSFQFFVNRIEFSENSIYLSLLIFLFIFSNSIFNINGVRFWTASWFGVYIIFEVVINKNYKFILFSIIPSLIHISFITLPVILVFYSVFPKSDFILIGLFFISFFVGEISLLLLENYKSLFPQSIQNLVWSYTEGSFVQDKVDYYDNLPLYARVLRGLPRYYIILLMVIFIFNRHKLKYSIESYSIFMFLLIWLSFSNFTMAIPSFGSRFIVLSVPLLMFLSLINFNSIRLLKYFIVAIPFVYSYVLLYWLRNMISVTDPYLLFSIFPHILLKNL